MAVSAWRLGWWFAGTFLKGIKMKLSMSRFSPIVFGLLTLALMSLTAHTQAVGASESVLWNFGNGTDGYNPLPGLIMDKSGNLYGTTHGGGADDVGAVFELTPPSTSGGNWTELILWSFGNVADGAYPYSPLTMDESGSLYGTTPGGGAYYQGTVFELTPPSASGGNWSESILWNFGNGTDGQLPLAGLIMDKSRNLYGTTEQGGAYGGGTVFEISDIGAEINVMPEFITFPDTVIGNTSTVALKVRNFGTSQLIGTVYRPAAPFGLSGSGSFNLAPGIHTTFTLTFTPTSTGPTRMVVDPVDSNSVRHDHQRIALRGIGTP